jgi:hypothetical protein
MSPFLALFFQKDAQGSGLPTIPGGRTDTGAKDGEGTLFADAGGAFALIDFMDKLAVAQVPSLPSGTLGEPHHTVIAVLVFAVGSFSGGH